MAVMNFNGDEAVEGLKQSLNSNEELTEALNNASKKIADSFNESGGVVGGRLGAVMVNIWGDGSVDYFKKNLKVETEKFLIDKVKPIINNSINYAIKTTDAYQAGKKAE